MQIQGNKNIKYSRIGENQSQICNIAESCAYGNIDASYNWVNVEYPCLHTHRHWELFVIVSGRIEHRINGKTRLLSTGDACLIKPDDRHCFLYPEDGAVHNYQHFNIVISENYMASALSGYLNSTDIELSEENRYFTVDEYIINTVLDKSVIAQSYEKENYEFAAKILFNILLSKYFEQRIFPSPTPPWLSKILIDLNNPAYFGMSAKELSEKNGYSYSRLNQLFKLHIQKTVSEYHITVKMDYAKKKLLMTDDSVLSIAFDVGYYSVSAFNHKFKELFGVTPIEFRKHNS